MPLIFWKISVEDFNDVSLNRGTGTFLVLLRHFFCIIQKEAIKLRLSSHMEIRIKNPQLGIP